MKHCSLCQTFHHENFNICHTCHQLFSSIKGSNICVCGRYLNRDEHRCGQCKATSYYFSHMLAGYRYSYPLNRLLNQYKHHHSLLAESVLFTLWQEHIQSLDSLPDAFVPIPLHLARRIHRGFNQAHRLALIASKEHHRPIIKALKKSRYTVRQQHKDKTQRAKNLINSFCLRRPVTNLHIAIIDDVYTTGSTANEAAKVLMKNGAKQVDIWVLAHAF